MAGELKPRVPKIRTRFRRPILMALLFCAPFARAMNRGNVAFAGSFGHIVDDV